MSGILEAGEVPKKLVEFKDSWYGVAQKCEGLAEYKSGLAEGFKDSLSELKGDVVVLGEMLDEVCISVQHHVPRERDKVEELRSPTVAILRELESAIDGNLEDLTRYSDLTPKLEGMTKNLEALNNRHGDLKKHVTRICEQYSQSKEAHEQRISNIRDATDRKLGMIKERFVSEVGSMFEGYDIVTKGRREEVNMELLLERLIQEPGYYQKVDVVHKGLFGRKRSDIEARLILLQYKAEEVTKTIAPILEEEGRRISKYEPEEKRIQDLGIQCSESGEEEKSLSSKRNSLEGEVKELKAEVDGIREKFTDYNRLLELVDSYVRKFGETTASRTEIAEVIAASMEAYEPVERDVEKRELRAEAKSLGARLNTLQAEKSKIGRELQAGKKQLGEQKGRIQDLSTEVETGKAKEEKLGKQLTGLRSKKRELEEELGGARGELEEKSNHIEVLEDRTATLEGEKEGLLKELETAGEGLEKKSSEIESIQGELTEQRELTAELEKKYDELGSGHREMASELDVAKAEAKGLKERVRETSKEREALKRELEKKERVLEKQVRALGKTTGKLEVEVKKYNASQGEIKRHKAELAAEKKKYLALERKYAKITAEADEVRTDVKALEREISRLARKPSAKKKAKGKQAKGKRMEEGTGEEELKVVEKISTLRKSK